MLYALIIIAIGLVIFQLKTQSKIGLFAIPTLLTFLFALSLWRNLEWDMLFTPMVVFILAMWGIVVLRSVRRSA